jgi:hypothetical protein
LNDRRHQEFKDLHISVDKGSVVGLVGEEICSIKPENILYILKIFL